MYRKLRRLLYIIFVASIYKLRLKQFSIKSIIVQPLSIDGAQNISISKAVYIGKHSWLAAMDLTNNKPHLVINSGSKIGNFNHIYCTHSIIIESNVLTADKVYISDNLHSYEDVSTPIMGQPIKQLRNVVIGSGAWLGENVCVIGASIGKGSVIGANSVVTKDIPDYCVAVGAPAKVVKRYNFETKTWEKLN